jgi:predicted small metal-binding protein
MALEIRCSDLGNPECSWKAVSNTEDRLVDYAAVHARDHHGVKEFSQEMIATVKNKVGEPVDLHEDDGEPEMREYHCPDCSWRYIAQTEALIADAAALHAREEHNVTVFTEEMITGVKNNLQLWSGH